MTMERIDITQPLWDQSTFVGRFRHFAFISNPLLSLASEEELHQAKDLYLKYKSGKEPAGTKYEQLVRAKQLYESAFHPDSGELQNVFGRMSFQMPGGCLITGAMLQWYRTPVAVVFLAMGEPVVQCPRELHQPERELPPHDHTDGSGVRLRHFSRHGHCADLQVQRPETC